MDAYDFGLNLAVEFIGLAVGVPVTIYFVDWLIKKREEKRRLRLNVLINQDILYLAYNVLKSIWNAQGLSIYEALQFQGISELGGNEDIRRRIKCFCERFSCDVTDAYDKLLKMNPSAWKQIIVDFENHRININNIFFAYAVYLEPKSSEHLIIIRNALWNAITICHTFPDAFNVDYKDAKGDVNLRTMRSAAVFRIGQLVSSVSILIELTEGPLPIDYPIRFKSPNHL